MSAPSLTDFLLARISEDEAMARAAAWGHLGFVEWRAGEHYGALQVQTVANEDEESVAITCDHEGLSDSVATPEIGAHIARHDPARVLADCEAKRRIVELHAVEVRREWVNPLDGPAYQEDEFSCAICDWFPSGEGCDTIKALATAYADHPDYREEWRP